MVSHVFQSFVFKRFLCIGILGMHIAWGGFVEAAEPIPTLDLQQLIDRACADGQQMIVLPPGTYHVNKTVVLDQRYVGLTITGQGQTTLIMTRLEPLMFINGAQDLTIDGFTLDYDPLPFTQVTITRIENCTVTFAVQDGYPRLSPTYLTTHQLLLFDGNTRQWKWAQQDNWQHDLKMLSPTQGQFTLAKPSDRLAVGDSICLDSRVSRAFFLRAQARNIAFSNLTILASPGLCFDARRTAGRHRFTNVVVKRGPTPVGATQPRLISSSADGINYADTRQGPMIDHCDLSWIGDDGVNLHGSTLPVIRVDDDGSFLVVLSWRPKDMNKVILPGDDARLLASGTFAVLGQHRIVSFEPMEGLQGVSMEEVKRYYHAASMHEMGLPNFILYRMKLADVTPVQGQYIDVPAASCPGYCITASRFANHRARGVRIMASFGTISHCTFADIEQSAIYLGPEYSSWMEAGWVHNISVLNNHITNVCQGAAAWSPYYYAPGAITISGHPDQGDNMIHPGNHNILVRDNVIDGSGVSAIAVLAGRQILLQDNTYLHTNTAARTSEACRSFGVNYQPTPVFLWPKATQNVLIHSTATTLPQ
jgi:hypothetical protein